MRYKEILSHISDEHTLSSLGTQHGLELSLKKPVKELQRRISERLQDPVHLREYIKTLPTEEQQGLKVAVLGSETYSAPTPDYCHRHLDEIGQKGGKKGNKNGGKIMASLISRGLVFPGRDDWYRNVYIVPDEVRRIVLELTAASVAADWPDQPAQPAEGRSLLTLLTDVHVLLGWLRREPLRLTRNGLIYRREQQRLLSHFCLPEQFLPADKNAYPPLLALLLDFCSYLGITRVLELPTGSGRLVTTEKTSAWMARSLNQQLQDLTSFIKHTLLSPPRAMLGKLLIMLGSLGEGKWLSDNKLLDELKRYAANPWYDPWREEDRALSILDYLGFIESEFNYETQAEGDIWIRLTKSGRELYLGTEPNIQEEDTFLVQPNYELLVPRELRPAVRWELEAFTDLVKNDQMVVLRLSRESIYRAFKNGEDISTVLPFLEQHSRVPLPDNVVYSLKEWSERCGAMYLEHPLLLTCRTPEQADEIAADPRFAPFLRGSFTPRHLLVDPLKYQELLAALEKAGYMPRPSIETGDEDA